MFSEHERRLLAGKAASAHERLAGMTAEPGGEEFNSPHALRRRRSWEGSATAGNRFAFERRVSSAGWSDVEVRRLASDTPWTAEIPAWLAVTEDYLQQLALDSKQWGENAQTYSLPFEPALEAYRTVFLRRLEQVAPDGFRMLSAACLDVLSAKLIQDLAHLHARTLYAHFCAFRSVTTFGFDAVIQESSGHDTSMRRFLCHLAYGGMKRLYVQYALLARLAATAVIQWAEAIAEFTRRLTQDREALHAAFGYDVELHDLVVIPGNADPHEGHRIVLCVLLPGEHRIVYKPRSTGQEEAFGALLTWLESKGFPEGVGTLKNLRRPTHVWIEFVCWSKAESFDDVRAYYTNAGRLLCILHWLSASDAHHENLVATRSRPQLVDFETALSPQTTRLGLSSSHDVLFQNVVQKSVINTLMLPWYGWEGSELVDLSALGGQDDCRKTRSREEWQAVDTDSIALVATECAQDLEPNLLVCGGEIQRPYDYCEELVQGFTQAYEFLLHHKSEVLEQVLLRFSGTRARFVFRPTFVYATLLAKAVYPAQLKSGADAFVLFEHLAAPLVDQGAYPSALLAEEHRALANHDVPLFSYAFDGKDLDARASDGESITIPNVFESPGAELIRESFAQFGADDLQLQRKIIWAAVRTYNRPRNHGDDVAHASSILKPRSSRESEDPTELDDHGTRARAAVLQIADFIARTCIGSETSVVWLGIEASDALRTVQFKPLGPSLHSGTLGILLFLSEVDHSFGTVNYQGLVDRGLCRVADLLQSARLRSQLLREFGPGLLHGAAGVAYAAARIAENYGLDRYRSVASEAFALVLEGADELRRPDLAQDLFSGCPGVLLALLSQPVLNRPHERAICAIAETLLSRATEWGDASLSWPCLRQTPMSGFGHGNAGVSHALAQFHAFAGDARYLEASKKGRRWLTRLFEPGRGNWSRFSPEVEDDSAFWDAWCNGFSGICLGLIESLRMGDDSIAATEIRALIDRWWEAGDKGVDGDYLCCGRLGKTELLLAAWRTFQDPIDLQRAQRIAAGTIRRAASNPEAYAVWGVDAMNDLAASANPGLWLGLAGIGYQILRTVDPEGVPSLLLFESRSTQVTLQPLRRKTV